jgi:hypothetical protein
VIENWLTEANELSFTVPYSQVLALQGHRILHISPKKATLEQGKDIVSLDREGVVHCYQLKGGDVTLNRWRTEIKPEVEAMIDLPPQHPSLRKVMNWQSHLVVNGELKGEAPREIVDTQRAREESGKRSFDVIGRGDLLRAFSDGYGKYLPTELADFATFIDVYRENGLEPLNKRLFSSTMEALFATALSSQTKRPSKNALRQQITASVVSVSLLLANKYRKRNHIGVIEGWLMLMAHIFAVAERNKLAARYWQPSTSLIEKLVDEAVTALLCELEQSVHYAQPSTVPFADSYVYKPRVTLLAGYLSAYCAYRRLSNNPSTHEGRVAAFLDEAFKKNLIKIKGESQVPLVANVAIFYYLIGGDGYDSILSGCVRLVLEARDRGELFDPYADIQEIIRTELGITYTPTMPNGGANSYTLWPVVLLLAHLGYRKTLAARWRQISEVSMHEFKPAEPWQWFLWRCAHGKQESRFPQQTQSWSRLVAFAQTPDESLLPVTMRESPHYLPLLLCLMPHRMSGFVMRTLIAAFPNADVVPSSTAE